MHLLGGLQINWKAGKTLNRATKAEIKAWVEELK